MHESNQNSHYLFYHTPPPPPPPPALLGFIQQQNHHHDSPSYLRHDLSGSEANVCTMGGIGFVELGG